MIHTLDARRMLCPMPVIRTQDKIKTLSVGDILEVTCTDPGALNDIPAWCRINGHKIVNTREQDDEVIVTVEVCAQS
jgi:tRNA 2-thiouridine synthesizing protein A